MIYRTTEPALLQFIDRYRTGNYGEDRIVTRMSCSRCSGHIRHGDSYYILDDAVYCMDCREYAEAHILRDVRDSYIYVL